MAAVIVWAVALPKHAIYRDCPWCGVRDAQFRLQAEVASGPQTGGKIRTFHVLTCPRCAGALLIESPNGGVGEIAVLPDAGASVGIRHLPPDVERYYRDAQKVMHAGVPDAVAVQLRRTLEAAAAHHGVSPSRRLVGQVQELIDRGLITASFGKVLDHIRQVGNVGAHYTDEQLDDATIERAFAFTTQVLRNLFEIPAELAAIDEQPVEPVAGPTVSAGEFGGQP